MNIGIIGCGFVGLANATLLSQNNQVFLWDVNTERLELISNHIIPFDDRSLYEAWRNVKYDFVVCDSGEMLIDNSEIIILALPTDLDPASGELKLTGIQDTISEILGRNRDVTIIIRSTVSVGFTHKMQKIFDYYNILFMPEFLREGMAYADMVSPHRIVIGGNKVIAEKMIEVYKEAIMIAGGKSDIKTNILTESEAEAVKLFSNTYLAMRVAFFNEIDTFAEKNGLNSKAVIEGICEDYRIGNYYNNPSFGYGGYCLPKDVTQTASLLKEDGILVKAIDSSNENRKRYVEDIICEVDGAVGFYRLQAKRESKNIRCSAMIDIFQETAKRGKKIYIYEPLLSCESNNSNVIFVNSLQELNDNSEIIVANSFTDELIPYKCKVYTRDQKFDY